MSICRSAAEFLARSAILFPVFALWFSASTAAQTSFELRSPDNRIQVRIRVSENIQYDVLLGGRTLLENSTFSLDLEHKALGLRPKVLGAKERESDQIIKPTVRQKSAQIREHYKELPLSMEG